MTMLKTINNTVLRRIKRAEALRLWIIICLLFMLLSSCKQVSTSYIISKEDSLYKVAHTNADGSVLFPPKVKYATYTFVVDSNNNVYFYSFPEENREGGGVFDDEEPDSIGLMPNHLIIIPKGCEKIFFEENVLFLKSSRSLKPVILSSFKDTIDNEFVTYVKEASLNKSNKIWCRIRMTLPEERNVIYHKINGLYYQSAK